MDGDQPRRLLPGQARPYDVASFFKPDGGIHRRFNVPACAVYVIGVAVQVPFISTTLFTGPIAKSLSDVDLSWLVGLAVVCPLYYWAAGRYLVKRPPTGAVSEREIPVVEVT